MPRRAGPSQGKLTKLSLTWTGAGVAWASLEAGWPTMKSLSQRAQPRVKYPVDVRLLAPAAAPPPGQDEESGPAVPRELHVRSHNLSASGILVEARQVVEVGTRVMCEIPLPGGTRRLAGEVARLQPLPFSSSAVGLGIRFVELESSARLLLEALVQREQEPAHLVHARFEGMAESIRSQAVLTKDGVRLSAALPFLRPGSTVEISFVSGRSRVLSQGIVREAVVDNRGPDGVPKLTVDVRLHNRTGGLGRPDDGAELIEEPDEDDVTAVDTPRALAAQIATRPSAARPAVQPVHRTIQREGRRPLHTRGRPRRPAPTPALASPQVAPRPDHPVWMVRAIKVGLGITGGLALFIIGVAVARQRLAPTPPHPVIATERVVPAPTIVPIPAAVPARAAASPPATDEAPPPADLPRTLYLPWRQDETRAGAPAPAERPRRPVQPAAAAPAPPRHPGPRPRPPPHRPARVAGPHLHHRGRAAHGHPRARRNARAHDRAGRRGAGGRGPVRGLERGHDPLSAGRAPRRGRESAQRPVRAGARPPHGHERRRALGLDPPATRRAASRCASPSPTAPPRSSASR